MIKQIDGLFYAYKAGSVFLIGCYLSATSAQAAIDFCMLKATL